MKANFEVTDTYGGEANYSWVRRVSVDVPDDVSDLGLVRRAKAWAGWDGMRTTTDNYGEMLSIKPRNTGACVVLFVTTD
jgi:hypothetical protein